MHENNVRAGAAWRAFRRMADRALALGMVLAAAGALFGLLCGGVLCLMDGLPWAYAAWWCLRGAFAGLAAGAIMGAVSGIYHVEEPARPASPAPEKSVAVNGAAPAPRPLAAARRNGVGMP